MKETKLTELLNNVCSSLGLLTVEKSSPIVYMVPNTDKDDDCDFKSEPLVSKNGLGFVLPYQENLRNLVVTDKNKQVLKYLPFNPLAEDLLQADTESLKILKERIAYVIRGSVFEVGFLLINYLIDNCKENKDFVIKKTAAIGDFLEQAGAANTKNVRKIVDDKTTDRWMKLLRGQDFPMAVITSLRNKEFDKVKYNRLTSITFPLLEELDKADRSKEHKINGVTLRNKDLEIFTAIFKTITRDLDLENYTYRVGSNDETSPGFMSLYGMYITIMKTILSIAKTLEPYAGSDSDIFSYKQTIKASELEDLVAEAQKFITLIPSERSLLTGENKAENATEDEVREVNKPSFKGVKTFGSPPKREMTGVEINRQPQQPNYNQPQYQTPPPVHLANREMSIEEKAANMFASPYGGYPVQPNYGTGPNMTQAIMGLNTGTYVPQSSYAQDVQNKMMQDYVNRTQQYPNPNQGMMYGNPTYGNQGFPMATPAMNLGPMPGYQTPMVQQPMTPPMQPQYQPSYEVTGRGVGNFNPDNPLGIVAR